MAYQVLPWFQFQAAAWHRGEFPTWDPHVWGGQPLIGQMQPGAAYPPNWLLFLLPLKDGRIQWIWLHLDFIVTHFFAALSVTGSAAISDERDRPRCWGALRLP